MALTRPLARIRPSRPSLRRMPSISIDRSGLSGGSGAGTGARIGPSSRRRAGKRPSRRPVWPSSSEEEDDGDDEVSVGGGGGGGWGVRWRASGCSCR